MKLSYIIAAIEEFAPRELQEDWDNTGLQVSFPAEAGGECTGVLLCVDVTEQVIAEAVERGCNLVLSHHPLIFKSLKRLTGSTVAERAAAAAVRAGVAVYSAHTSLDSTKGGISYTMAEKLGATVCRVLIPSSMKMERVSVICPRAQASDIRLALLGDARLKPTAWDLDGDKLETDDSAEVPTFDVRHTPLTRVEVTIPQMRRRDVIEHFEASGLKLRVEVQELSNRSEEYGLGVVADFEHPVTMRRLVELLHERFGAKTVRTNVSGDEDCAVRRIALCGGAGGEFIDAAAAAGAQAYITADLRYHDLAEHRNGPAIFDIGHFESEECAKDIFYNLLCKKFANFAVQKSQTEKNPVKYL